MPHGAPALHTWKVDRMGESLPGGEKKKKGKKKGCNVAMQVHTFFTYSSVTQMFGRMDRKRTKYSHNPKENISTGAQTVTAGVFYIHRTCNQTRGRGRKFRLRRGSFSDSWYDLKHLLLRVSFARPRTRRFIWILNR